MQSPSDETTKVAEINREQRHFAFEKFKQCRGLPPSAKITDRQCQREMKIGRDHTAIPYFLPYYGLTYISVIPPSLIERLASLFEALLKLLDINGFSSHFICVPKDTYHITFTGLEEGPSLDVDSLEIEYYKAAYPLHGNDEIPFEATVLEFFCYTNLALFAKALPQQSPISFRIGEKTERKKDFHITIAYFVDSVSEVETRILKACLEEASASLLMSPITFEVSDVQMFRFKPMAEYELVPGAGLL